MDGNSNPKNLCVVSEFCSQRTLRSLHRPSYSRIGSHVSLEQDKALTPTSEFILLLGFCPLILEQKDKNYV